MHPYIVSLVFSVFLFDVGQSQNYTCGRLPQEFEKPLLRSINVWRAKFGFKGVKYYCGLVQEAEEGGTTSSLVRFYGNSKFDQSWEETMTQAVKNVNVRSTMLYPQATRVDCNVTVEPIEKEQTYNLDLACAMDL
ncbi:hypothetical protein GCK32_010660 [Trichostrongylus colubriformis]|uniref:Secreted protein n=1 Tax=Trichostrongylus colubriformis TaxID=6319 RepID=A0AAN8GDG7_TRICO